MRQENAAGGPRVLSGLFAARKRPERIPVFPLRTVLFPGGRLPLRVFEQRYMAMVKTCLKDERPFGICGIVSGGEVGAPASFEGVGTIARILSWDMPQLGILNLVTEGGARFKVAARETLQSGLAVAEVTLLDEEDAANAAAPPPDLVELLKRLIERVGAAHFGEERRYEDANWVSYRLAEILPMKPSIKQKLLEVNDSEVRLRVIAEFVRLQGLAPR